ncbi:Hexokinase type 2 [Orchesella cincta]|uniref:Phosphotransferase n=1 Tax=Orchesella cincta TaxID=48709 RepID=A0A1D2MVL1_ORCCI|nr:Hexokinase type 2 [Orchesella cincta]
MVTVSRQVKEVCSSLVLSDSMLEHVMGLMHDEICKGLSKETNGCADVKCFPTYVRNIPNGSERGKFLALDLGGTNFRVLLIELGGSQKNKMLSKIFAVPQSVMLGSGNSLFDHIADCLAVFMKEHGVQLERLPLGFTFSFPCRQEGLTKGRLVRWTKGFKCGGVEGEDVVRLLQAAIRRRGDVDIDVLAVLNDTTGTLMSCAHKNPECRVGIIIGTGTNACYLERLQNVGLWDGDFEEPQQVIINTEWGNFGRSGCLDDILTEYDREIDEKSLNPGEQVFEKMISGMYMGELARLVIAKLVKKGLLFRGQGSDILYKKGSFYTKYISEIESDKLGEYYNCREVLEELCLGLISDQDCQDIRYICEVVSTRAAQLAAAGVACLLNKMNEKKVVVGVDGSVYRFHPHFHNLMTESIEKLVSSDIKFELMLSEDGSGRGAALVAAVASRKS